MRSFSLLAFAAAALAPFVGAAPAPVDAGAVALAGARIHARDLDTGLYARAVDAHAAAKAKAAVHARSVVPDVPDVHDVPYADAVGEKLHTRGGKRGVAAILVDLKVNLNVHIIALYALDAKSCTKEALIPILKAIVAIIVAATVELKALVGLDLSIILISVDGTTQLAIGVIAQLLADVLCLVFGALGFVLGIVADVKIIIDVLVAVAFGDCICGLINAVLVLVTGLLGALIPLVFGLVGIILALGLNVVGKLLTIC